MLAINSTPLNLSTKAVFQQTFNINRNPQRTERTCRNELPTDVKLGTNKWSERHKQSQTGALSNTNCFKAMNIQQ